MLFVRSQAGPPHEMLSPKMLHIADQFATLVWRLPFTTLSALETAAHKAKYLADMRVKFLVELVREHSAPAQDEIPSARDQPVPTCTGSSR